jgi:hypothetical protein
MVTGASSADGDDWTQRRAGRNSDESDVRTLLRELDELQELDRRRRQEPRDSAAYVRAVREVDRRSRALINRLSAVPRATRPRFMERRRGQPA